MIWRISFIIVICISCILSGLGLSSCRTTRAAGQISQTEHTHDTVTAERWHDIREKDSVFVADSMSVEYKMGTVDSVAGVRIDTLRETRWHKEKRVRSNTATEKKADTVYKTVQKTVTRTVREAEPLAVWQRLFIGIGETSCLVALMVLLVVFIRKRVNS